MHYYKFHIADYRKDTGHLTPIEHYIYRTLIDWVYLDECEIPKENPTLLRRLSLGLEFEQNLKNVLDDFFIETENGYKHDRILDDIKAYRSTSERARENGKKGGRPKKQELTDDKNPEKTNPVFSANQEQTICKANHKPLTNNQYKKNNRDQDHAHAPAGKNLTKPEYSERFSQFWDFARSHYTRIANPIGNKLEAYELFKKLKPTDSDCHDWLRSLLAQVNAKQAIREQGGSPTQLKHLSRWLKHRGWEDLPDPVPAGPPKPGQVQILSPSSRKPEFRAGGVS